MTLRTVPETSTEYLPADVGSFTSHFLRTCTPNNPSRGSDTGLLSHGADTQSNPPSTYESDGESSKAEGHTPPAAEQMSITAAMQHFVSDRDAFVLALKGKYGALLVLPHLQSLVSGLTETSSSREFEEKWTVLEAAIERAERKEEEQQTKIRTAEKRMARKLAKIDSRLQF